MEKINEAKRQSRESESGKEKNDEQRNIRENVFFGPNNMPLFLKPNHGIKWRMNTKNTCVVNSKRSAEERIWHSISSNIVCSQKANNKSQKFRTTRMLKWFYFISFYFIFVWLFFLSLTLIQINVNVCNGRFVINCILRNSTSTYNSFDANTYF